MAKTRFDVAVLGAGPGGYPAAVRLAQGGKKVALIEESLLGGTCLNWGCIPTKALLASVNVMQTAREAEAFGVSVGEVVLDWTKAVERKNAIVEKLRSGLRFLMESNAVRVVRGRGKLVSPRLIAVTGADESEIEADQIILATGSGVKELPFIPFDGKRVHSSSTILNLQTVPKSMAILGAGAIGCEFASLFARLGTKVTLIEALSRILPNECAIATKALEKAFVQQGIDIICGQKVTSYSGDGKLTLENGRMVEAEVILVAVGRTLNTAGIGLEEIGISMNKGAVVTNDRMMTNIDSIYAIGDLTAKVMLAHVATHQGLVAAENILRNHQTMAYDAIPGVVYTTPEYASVGMSFEEAKKRGISATMTTFPFQALGKAHACSGEEGFVQIVFERSTGRILGAQAVGPSSEDLVAEATMAITNELTLECVMQTIHAHPTYSECWSEVCFAACGLPISLPKSMVTTLV